MRVAVAAIAVVVALSPHARAVAGRTVQIGYCTSVKNLAAAKGAGFDYVEPGRTELTSLSDAGRTTDD